MIMILGHDGQEGREVGREGKIFCFKNIVLHELLADVDRSPQAQAWYKLAF